MTKIQNTPPENIPTRELIALAARITQGEQLDTRTLSRALFIATAFAYHGLAEKFLAAGADATTLIVQKAESGLPQKSDTTAVVQAVYNDDADMIKLFSQYGVNFYKTVRAVGENASPINAMHAALISKKEKAAQALVDTGFDILHPDLGLEKFPWDFTLRTAIGSYNSKIALRMISSLPNAESLHRYSILAQAAKTNLCDVLQAVLEKGIAHNQPFDVHGLTYAAYCALGVNSPDSLCLLLEKGADPNLFFTVKNHFDDLTSANTLLHQALTTELLSDPARQFAVRRLLQEGADPNIVSRMASPQNAFEMAKKRTGIAPLLSQARRLRGEFILAKMQPAIDRIYHGGDKALPLPTRRRMP